MRGATLIIQSAPPAPPAWLERCMASVVAWAALRGYRYRRLDDRLFDRVPADIVARLGQGARIPLSDIARLLALEAALAEGYARVAWLDADILVFDPPALALPDDTPFACAREFWIWADADGLHARHTVNNALLSFATRDGLLEWYLDAAHQILRTAPLPLERLTLGPQLLSDLHNRRALPLMEGVATLSPLLIEETITGGGAGLVAHRAAWRARVAGAHLCRSLGHTGEAPALVHPSAFDPAIDRLLADGPALLNDPG